jgi:hypothetical protein
MNKLQSISIALTLSAASVASAAEFDGKVPLTCTAEHAHDCLPANDTCKRLKPQTDIPAIFGIDFSKKQIRSPYRTAILPMLHTATNADSLVMQGADLLVAWSALIDRKSGALTVSIADSKGAYIAFGQCKVAETK